LLNYTAYARWGQRTTRNPAFNSFEVCSIKLKHSTLNETAFRLVFVGTHSELGGILPDVPSRGFLPDTFSLPALLGGSWNQVYF
jgi:hypothetical protein